MTGNYYPSRLTLDKPSFPYFIAEENQSPTSYISIDKATDKFMGVDSTLFYVAGASLEQRSNSGGGK